MKLWILPLIMAVIALTGCDIQNNDEQTNSVTITKLERQSLHFWRVRALSEETSGPWSEPSYFRILHSAAGTASASDRATTLSGVTASPRTIHNVNSAAKTLTKTEVKSNGVFEDIVLPMPAWHAVDSALGFEFEIVDVDANEIKVSRLLNQRSVCGGTGCATLLVELDATGNALPRAVIGVLETDPAQPNLLKFTAENSVAPDGVISMYRWRIDGRYIGTPTSVNFEYLFNDSGSYRVGLEVSDDTGTTNLTFIDVQVGMPTESTPNGGNGTGTLPLTNGAVSPPQVGPGSGQLVDIADNDAGQVIVSEPITTSTIESWQLRGTANAVITIGNTIIVGGDFTEIYNASGESLPRNNLAALNRHTGQPNRFAPNLNGEVWALALSPDNGTLYVGGSFLMAEGLPRPRIAAYDVQTGMLTNFVTQTPNRALRAIAINEDRVYLGGLFTKIGNTDRQYVAAFDRTTGQLDQGFTTSPDDIVTALVVGQDRLWIGGSFRSIDGIAQRGVGALNAANGSFTPTDDVDYRVIDMASTDTQLFVAGGDEGGSAAAINRASGLALWEISGDGKFQAVDVDNGRFVYFGGHFEEIAANVTADRLTRHDKSTGALDSSWLPRVNGIRSINALDVTPDGLYIGGDFTAVNGELREGVAIFSGLTD